MLHCGYCVAFVSEFAMNDVVEDILNTYQSMRPLDAERAADSRQRISRYIENLASAGERDAEQLTIYGLAYLTELHEGQDPRFTGC
jgi:glycerol-3-phosphate dehydrogenase